MVSYEWMVEVMDGEDVAELYPCDVFVKAEECASELRAGGKTVEVCLVRNVWDNYDGDLNDRQWAYIEDGALPTDFDGGAPVPIRFLKSFMK